jgi:hypothetical protein
LPSVETRSAASLLKELTGMRLDPAVEQVDLSDRMPIRRQSDAEWAARQALVEYQYRKPLDFQGTGDLVFRTGAKAPPAGELLTSMLKDQLAGQLSSLLEEPKAAEPKRQTEVWLASAVRTAEQEEVSGFRVTRVSPDAAAQRVAVETRFVSRSPAGRWETAWRHAESVDASRPDKERMDRITQDPQVKQALESLRAAGLGASEDKLQAALRLGAATMKAQQSADVEFYKFRDRYLQRLDGPPLKMPEGPAR